MTTARDALGTTSIFRFSTYEYNLNLLNQSKHVFNDMWFSKINLYVLSQNKHKNVAGLNYFWYCFFCLSCIFLTTSSLYFTISCVLCVHTYHTHVILLDILDALNSLFVTNDKLLKQNSDAFDFPKKNQTIKYK
jgi:hypothetical protein